MNCYENGWLIQSLIFSSPTGALSSRCHGIVQQADHVIIKERPDSRKWMDFTGENGRTNALQCENWHSKMDENGMFLPELRMLMSSNWRFTCNHRDDSG